MERPHYEPPAPRRPSGPPCHPSAPPPSRRGGGGEALTSFFHIFPLRILLTKKAYPHLFLLILALIFPVSSNFVYKNPGLSVQRFFFALTFIIFNKSIIFRSIFFPLRSKPASPPIIRGGGSITRCGGWVRVIGWRRVLIRGSVHAVTILPVHRSLFGGPTNGRGPDEFEPYDHLPPHFLNQF